MQRMLSYGFCTWSSEELSKALIFKDLVQLWFSAIEPKYQLQF